MNFFSFWALGRIKGLGSSFGNLLFDSMFTSTPDASVNASIQKLTFYLFWDSFYIIFIIIIRSVSLFDVCKSKQIIPKLWHCLKITCQTYFAYRLKTYYNQTSRCLVVSIQPNFKPKLFNCLI